MDQREEGRAVSASAEWRQRWPLPVVAMLGLSGSMAFSLTAGVVMIEVTETFGWTRAQFLSGLTVHGLLSLLKAPIVGWAIQRFGPRRVALVGIVGFMGCFAALGLTDESIWHWRLLTIAVGLSGAFIAPALWITAVVARFDSSRGLAIAVAQAGLGVASIAWPLLAAYYLQTLGWRLTFGAVGLTFAVVVWPLVYFVFDDTKELARAKANSAGARASAWARLIEWAGPILRSLRDRTIICLIVAGSLYAAMSYGVNINLVPLIREGGFSVGEAAVAVSLSGLLAMAGRIGAGYALDHLPARWVGVFIFFIPALASALLILNSENSYALYLVAAVMFGAAAGGEADVIAYIASRGIPPEIFPTVYSIIIACFALTASFGPLIAGYIHDVYGSYDYFLMMVMTLVIVGSGFIVLIPTDRKVR